MNFRSFGWIVVGFVLLYPVQLTETVAFYNSQFCVNSYHPADEDINKKKNWIVFFATGPLFLTLSFWVPHRDGATLSSPRH
jgi:hypothetical protein